MRAVRELRPPGVYPATEEPRAKPLTVSDTRVAGFVGLAAGCEYAVGLRRYPA